MLCPVCTNWARCGPQGTFDSPHHPQCPVPGAAVELLLACKAVRLAWLSEANDGDGIREENGLALAAADAAIARAEGK